MAYMKRIEHHYPLGGPGYSNIRIEWSDGTHQEFNLGKGVSGSTNDIVLDILSEVQRKICEHTKTDLEKIEALFSELKIGYSHLSTSKGASILCEEGDAKISGYSAFYTVFRFDIKGKFIDMGAYE